MSTKPTLPPADAAYMPKSLTVNFSAYHGYAMLLDEHGNYFAGVQIYQTPRAMGTYDEARRSQCVELIQRLPEVLDTLAETHKAVESLYKQVHEAVEFSDSNEMTMDMEIECGISILKQQRDDLQKENDFLQAALSAFDWQRINSISHKEVEAELLAAGYTKEALAAGLAKIRATVEAAIAKRDAVQAATPAAR